jgi:hypothetical protein
MTKLIHPNHLIDKLIKKNERGDSFSLMDHQREILRLAFDFDQDGPAAMGYDSLFLRQEVGEDDDQRGLDPGLRPYVH